MTRELRKRSEAKTLAGVLSDSIVAAGGAPPPPVPSESRDSPAAPPPLYATARGGEVAADFQRIVETLHAADAFLDYDELEKHLEVGENRGDRATLREYLDKGEVRARRAHRVLLGAKLELAKWKLESRKIGAALRDSARKILEDEEAAGHRTKKITNDDVLAAIDEHFGDEVADQAIKTAKYEGTVESLEHLVRRWDAKCGDLRTLLETLR